MYYVTRHKIFYVISSRSKWKDNVSIAKGNATVLKELDKMEVDEMVAKGKKPSKPFYEKFWKWVSLVPMGYRRTLAPRITASGGTLHAMKKDMSNEVLKLVSQEVTGYTFIDIDLSACHAHIAAALQGKSHSLLSTAVTQAAHFWNEMAKQYKRKLQDRNIHIEESAIRSILKVSFYTSLNGGNPFNANRLGANLKLNAPDMLTPFDSIEQFASSECFKTLNTVLGNLEIISEVKQLNQVCTLDKRTYTVDRRDPHPVDSVHKGISRVLQGVEVVLLSILVGFIKQRGGLPLNLAHDGTLVMVRDDQDPVELCKQLTRNIKGWSRFVLRGFEIGVEPKLFVSDGKLSKL